MTEEERLEMIDGVIDLLPDEMENEDIVCLMMSIVGVFTNGREDATSMVNLFASTALAELLDRETGYFERIANANH